MAVDPASATTLLVNPGTVTDPVDLVGPGMGPWVGTRISTIGAGLRRPLRRTTATTTGPPRLLPGWEGRITFRRRRTTQGRTGECPLLLRRRTTTGEEAARLRICLRCRTIIVTLTVTITEERSRRRHGAGSGW